MSDSVSVSLPIAAPAELVYDLVADLPRMGEWSPECHRCDWLGGATAAAPGVKFRGRNRGGGNVLRRWSTTGTIVAAERGREISWDVTTLGPLLPVSRWSYRFTPTAEGCVVEEAWEDLRSGWYRATTGLATGVSDRKTHNEAGMRATLEQLKAAAEAASSG